MTCTAPRAELAAVGANTSMVFNLFGYVVESRPSAVPSGHDIEVVEVGKEELVVLQARASRNERVVQAESKKSWHERVPLLAAFPLEDVEALRRDKELARHAACRRCQHCKDKAKEAVPDCPSSEDEQSDSSSEE